MTSRDTALSFLFGAAMGAAAGVLLAPASGHETRQRLRRRGEQTLDRGRETLENTKDSVMDKADAVRDRVSNLADGAHQWVDAARAAVGEGKATYRRELEKPSTP